MSNFEQIAQPYTRVIERVYTDEFLSEFVDSQIKAVVEARRYSGKSHDQWRNKFPCEHLTVEGMFMRWLRLYYSEELEQSRYVNDSVRQQMRSAHKCARQINAEEADRLWYRFEAI